MTGDLMLPARHRVSHRWPETADCATIRLEPLRDPLPAFAPGQFTMLYAPGVGEVAISISGDPSTVDGTVVQTIRNVGAVSRALSQARPGSVLGVRGPYGTGWDLDSAAGRDLVIVAGGVGLAPLRPIVLGALARRAAYGRVVLIAGARTPADFLFGDQLTGWAGNPDLEVHLTVDRPAAGWSGPVGFVTEPLASLDLDPARTTAFLCGPEPMMRFSARVLQRAGVAATDIRVSLERNMKCGVALCGHCQLGELLVCRDGPVVDYSVAEPLLTVPEL
ncbi:FAD/NAD(P)-binding protein [Fodinicola acaciae]|uniref:FAD/NAD(P)-binding protein n=1 Tax=Fodinicola acaciae TaxID=2681555 RepID=UPI0013D647CE|nr:FAD/NAD(P)-binding protein [Fodinicola acaciae]